MALFGLVRADNLADVTDRERVWDNIGAVVDSEGVPEPDYPNVSLLLHGDGTNGSTSIIDSSPSPKTVTAVGNAQISTAQSKFGGASIAFDGTGDYLDVVSSSVFDFGSGNFTIEWWQKIPSTTTRYSILNWKTGDSSINIGNGVFQMYVGGGMNVAGNVAVTYTTDWQHVAFVRSNGIVTFYLDGVSKSNNLANLSAYVFTPSGIEIGKSAILPNLNGYIDDLRITTVARYTANFTPPTAPFYDSSNNSLVNLTLAVTGRDILALEAVRNVSTRDFVFIKSLSSPAQPRLTSAAASAASAASLRDNALLRASPVSTGDYTISGFFLDAASLRINNVSVASIATTPFSGSTATTSLLISSFLAPANFRFTQAMTSGTVLTGDRAIPIEGNDLILYAKAGQN
jgi:hypothetical protein